MLLWLQNYLCYQLVQLPKHVQRYFAIAGVVLSAMYSALLLFIGRDIIKPAANLSITSQEQALHAAGVILLAIVGYVGLKIWLLAIDNPITNKPCKERHKSAWSWVNFAIFIHTMSGFIFLMVTFVSTIIATIAATSSDVITPSLNFYSYLLCVLALYLAIVINTHLLRGHARAFSMLFPFTGILGRVFLTMPEQFTFLSDKYSGHHIEAMIRDKQILSFRNILELHYDCKIFPVDDGDLPARARVFELIKNTQHSESMKWAILAYLSANNPVNAGKLITKSPQQPVSWLGQDDYRFFDLHEKPTDIRLQALQDDILAISNVLVSKMGMSEFINTWNLSPYAFIDSDSPDIRRTALSLL